MTTATRALPGEQLKSRVKGLLDRLTGGLFEREEAVRLCLLTALARESIFLLGPPGVAKSMIARRLKGIFPREARAFEYLMNRFSTPDEIFGPVSIQSLKNEDELVRKTERYLPKATVVFLDEIWKAGPSIQNTLLTVINERVFRNAGRDEAVDLRVLVSASNELPAAGKGLEALWDRFLVRLVVGPVTDPDSRRALIRGDSMDAGLDIPDQERFSLADLDQIEASIKKVDMPPEVLMIFDAMVKRIEEHNRLEGGSGSLDPTIQLEEHADLADPDEAGEYSNRIYVSDRRWKKIGRLLRVCALANGRAEVDIVDCFLAHHCIWDHQGQKDRVDEIVLRAIRDSLEQGRLEPFRKDLADLEEEVHVLQTTQAYALQPFRGHYRLDLSTHKRLLTGGSPSRTYSRMPTASFDSLIKRFQPIELQAERGESVQVEGRWESVSEVRLRKVNEGGPLKPFQSTVFRFRTSAKARTRRVPVDGERARQYLGRARELQDRARAGREAIERERKGLRSQAADNLFVDLSEEPLQALTDSYDLLLSDLDRMRKHIDELVARAAALR